MTKGHSITVLGTGLIGMFYASALNSRRGLDHIQAVYSRNKEKAGVFAGYIEND